MPVESWLTNWLTIWIPPAAPVITLRGIFSVTVVEQLNATKGLIHAEELALLLGMNRDKLYKKTKAGEVPHYRVLGRVKYDPEVIARWLQLREVGIR